MLEVGAEAPGAGVAPPARVAREDAPGPQLGQGVEYGSRLSGGPYTAEGEKSLAPKGNRLAAGVVLELGEGVERDAHRAVAGELEVAPDEGPVRGDDEWRRGAGH